MASANQKGRDDMKTSIGTFIAVAGMALVLMDPAPARAAEVMHSTGKSAYANFFDFGQCVYSQVAVSGRENATVTPPGGPAMSAVATVSISSFDFCIGSYLSGFASAPAQTFQIDDALNSAQLDATVPFCDFVSGSCFDVAIDMTWTATGTANRNINTVRSFFGFGSSILTHSLDLGRAATATGSVSDGTQNFTPHPSTFGNAYMISADVVQIQQE
jgi:hypothetical protein